MEFKLGQVNPQTSCPLFTVFPPEIRQEVLTIAASRTPDTSKPYPLTSSWYRPGYIAPYHTSLSWLRVCKRFYLEGKGLIWRDGAGNNEETFWWGDYLRRPMEKRGRDGAGNYMATGDYSRIQLPSLTYVQPSSSGLVDDEAEALQRDKGIFSYIMNRGLHVPYHRDAPWQCTRTMAFTPYEWTKITRIHIISQMYAFDDLAFVRLFDRAYGLRPRVVKITLRVADWVSWELNEPLVLAIRPDPEAYYFPETVETLVLELESAKHKQAELEEKVKDIIDSEDGWVWKREDEEYLKFDVDEGVKEWEWIAPSTFGDGQSLLPNPDGEKMKYTVKVFTFRAKSMNTKWDGRPFAHVLGLKEYERKKSLAL